MDIEKLKKRCGYDGKPQQFKYGFDLACRELAKAQAVPEAISIGNELQSWVAVNSFSADDGEGVLPVVDANAIAEKIEELTGANQ